jgi:cell surface protein SprA
MISINEQFTPLFGIDMTWKNNLTSRFEYKKIRTLIFSLKSYSLSESRSNEYVIGLGYRFEEVPLKFITLSGSTSNVKSDLNLRGDLSIKNDYTVLRKFEQGSQPINAIRTVNLSITADYALSDKLNVNLFYKRDLNDTYGSYLNTNTQIGFSIRFTLTQ